MRYPETRSALALVPSWWGARTRAASAPRQASRARVLQSLTQSPELRRRWRSAAAVVIAVVVFGSSAFQSAARQDQQAPQPPPTFRTGTNVIRVDATVIDRHGHPVPSLTAADFEVREDGKPQNISSFRFISADGQPSDDRSLPIRSQQHAATEAVRDDVRTFLIFWATRENCRWTGVFMKSRCASNAEA